MFLNSEKGHTKIETVVGAETEIEGSLRTNKSIRVDGKLKGGINAESVIIGEHGIVLGDVTANRVTVAGRVKGNIAAASNLELLAKGQILGDIRTSKLIIADGATFEGNCQMVKPDGQIIEMTPDSYSTENGDLPSQKTLKVIGNGKR